MNDVINICDGFDFGRFLTLGVCTSTLTLYSPSCLVGTSNTVLAQEAYACKLTKIHFHSDR